MKTAIIGLGVIGGVHIQVLKSQGKEISAVCDTDAARLLYYSEYKGYSDYKKMIEEVKPDIVHICTPHYLHTEMILYALGKNINVLCEKPLCIRSEDIPLILEAEKNSEAQLGVVLQNRFNAPNVYVKEYIKNKKVIGGYGVQVWCRDEKYYSSAEWRGTRDKEGGGVLINQALHALDILEWFIGEPEYITASLSNLALKGKIEVEDTAVIKCEGGANFTFFATNGSNENYPLEINLFLEGGENIKIFPDWLFINGERIELDVNKTYFGKVCYGAGHASVIGRFYDCVAKGEKYPTDGKEGAKSVKLILAAYRSNGEKIKI